MKVIKTPFGKSIIIALTLMLMLVTALSLGACGGSNEDTGNTDGQTEPVRIGTKPMTESRIIGEMLGLLIKGAGYEVEITKDIAGGTTNIMPLMEKGDLDLYPEYTGTGWMTVLKHDDVPTSGDELFANLNEEYQSRFDMKWVGLYGFNNTYTFAVSNDFADKYKLVTMSDLAKVSDKAVFGGNGDYMERADGFEAVKNEYGFDFKDVMDIDMGLKYEALKSGEIDVTNAFTTDAQLSKASVIVLKDDKGFFGEYLASTVVRNDALKKFPKLEEILNTMDGIISDREMSSMNYSVEVDGKDEATVAEEYLINKGLIEQ